jgi:hypothetical protein
MRTRMRCVRWLPLGFLLVALMGAKGTGCATTTLTSYSSPGYHAEKRYARKVFGNDAAEQRCLVALWTRESGWSPDAVESQPIRGHAPTYAYGIPQANPAYFGHPFAMGDWRAQIRWGRWYIRRRYGDACTAWDHEVADGWY